MCVSFLLRKWNMYIYEVAPQGAMTFHLVAPLSPKAGFLNLALLKFWAGWFFCYGTDGGMAAMGVVGYLAAALAPTH